MAFTKEFWEKYRRGEVQINWDYWEKYRRGEIERNTDYWKSDEYREKMSKAMSDYWGRVHAGLAVFKKRPDWVEKRQQTIALNNLWKDLLSMMI